MSDSILLQSRDNGVLTLTLNRPRVHNALSRDLLRELLNALQAARRDREIRAIILTGSGDTFSAGLDLNEFEIAARDRSVVRCQLLADVYEECAATHLPVICAMNGAAIAGGAGLALASDFLIIAEDAAISFPGAGKGLVAEVLFPVIVRAVGARCALSWLTGGESIGAAKLVAQGVANAMVPRSELVSHANALAQGLAALPPHSFAMHKASLRHAAQAFATKTRDWQPVVQICRDG